MAVHGRGRIEVTGAVMFGASTRKSRRCRIVRAGTLTRFLLTVVRLKDYQHVSVASAFCQRFGDRPTVHRFNGANKCQLRHTQVIAKNIGFITSILLGVMAATGGIYLEAQKDFVPDVVFNGSSLSGWHALGRATWTARDGQIEGKAATGEGWLVSDKSFQDVRVFSRLQCGPGCNAGILPVSYTH